VSFFVRRQNTQFKQHTKKEKYMTREEIENCWKDPRNWKGSIYGIYYCKADPRVIVPKHPKWRGWTANFARPSAIPVVLLLLALFAVPVFIVAVKGAGIGLVLVTAAAAITVLCLLCAYLSSRSE
jgi:hypothetical protein